MPEVAPAGPSDLPAAARLIDAGFRQSLAATYELAGRVAFRMYVGEPALASRLSQGVLALVAREAGSVVGYAEVQGRGRVPAGRDHLSLLFVDPAWQRRGVARALLADILARLRRLPRPPAELTVDAAPSALAAYRRLGFTATGPEVVRQGVRAGVESYSIKRLEPIYGFTREIDLRDAGSSIVEFEEWLESMHVVSEENRLLPIGSQHKLLGVVEPN